MRAFWCLAVTLLVLGLAATATADHHEDLMKEVEAAGDAMIKAMLADDVEGMFAYYAEDVISLPSYSPRMDGVATLKKQHEEMTAAGFKIHSFDSNPTDVWKAGDQVIEIGTYTINLTVPGMPGPIDDKGKYLTVWERDAEGGLKVKVETWNSDMDPMAMGMMGGEGEMHEHEHEDGHEHENGHEHEGGMEN